MLLKRAESCEYRVAPGSPLNHKHIVMSLCPTRSSLAMMAGVIGLECGAGAGVFTVTWAIPPNASKSN